MAKTVEETEKPLAKSRLSESVYESIMSLIVSGELLPGQTVSELELARRLEVSRTPIHEAVKQLVKDGLIDQAANRRPVVVSFSSDDIFDVYEMRRILESEAAAKAATRIDRPTLDRLQRDLDAFTRNKNADDAIQRWVTLDDDFHNEIALASGSRRLGDDINRYRLLHRVFNRSHTDASVLSQAVAEHESILQAMFDRNADAARQAMKHHLEEWQRFFVNHLNR